MLTINDPAPAVKLETTTGEPVSLAEIWQSGRHGLLVFLRHLG
jgi:hypothetical protein